MGKDQEEAFFSTHILLPRTELAYDILASQ
jgi:hypothetical protein